MDDRLYDLILSEELPPEARRELVMALRHDPVLRKTFRNWREIQGKLRKQINTRVPDRKLLVLYALQESDEEMLTPAEIDQVQDARAQLEEALEVHPGLQEIVNRIQAEKDTFDAVWAEHTADQSAPERRFPVIQSITGSWVARAAAIAAFLVLTGLLYLSVVGPDRSMETVHAPANEKHVVELTDGSVVHLEANAVLEYRVSESESSSRYTRLQGTALFEIAPENRPFVVETPTAVARVLSTTFGLSSSSAETKLTVAEGQVAFSPPSDTVQAVVVSPGQTSHILSEGSPTAPAAVNLTEELGWSSYLFFRDTRVRDAVEHLTSQYNRSVTAADELADEALTGTFHRDQTLGKIVDVIAATLDARVERTSDGGYHLNALDEQN